jgi:hypothetical protein
MKNQIIYLGIALVLFANVSSASNHLKNVSGLINQKALKVNENLQENFKLTSEPIKQIFSVIIEEPLLNLEKSINTAFNYSIQEIIIADNKIIESVTAENTELIYIEKSIEEVILSDNQIIESNIDNEVRPIYLEKTIADFIAEDNQIIDSNISTESEPLDFKKINNSSNAIQQMIIEKFVGM